MTTHFEIVTNGIIVYKTFNENKTPPASWKIEKGEYITEVVNPDRGTDCGSGVNVATIDWVQKNCHQRPVWKCLIAWMDLAGVIVPFGTDGKIRAGRVKLIEPME
jgi:hypothetical protein